MTERDLAATTEQQYRKTLADYSAYLGWPAKPFKEACYRLIFRLPRKRDYDGLGAWVKGTIDGLVDAGILIDDADFQPMGIERIVGSKATGGFYGVRFVIWQEFPIE